jgi:hypothetical protein
MWSFMFTILSAVLVVTVMVLRFKGRRKRILAAPIPGPCGSLLIGSIPLLIHGPEKIIKNVREVYRT